MTNISLKKDSVLENIDIIDLGINNKGIAKIDSKVIFVQDTVPGDKVNIKIHRKRKGVFEAGVIEYLEYSPKRQDPFCKHFDNCGGCKIQHMKYEEQLLLKQKMVEDSLCRIAKLENHQVNQILGSEHIQYYRNKLEYSFSNKRWLTESEVNSQEDINSRNAIGFHVPGRFDRIIDIENCYLQENISDKIRNAVREFTLQKGFSYYDPIEQKGLLRNLIIRTSTLQELMVTVVFGDTSKSDISEVMDFISDTFPEITSLYYIINTKPNDSIFDLNPVFYRGKAHITEQIEHIEVLLGPKSFYQTNSTQAVHLYNIVKEYAGLSKNSIVYDLYSGVGSIGLFLAKDAGKIVGIETVREAVEDANINMSHNQIKNAHFVCGMVEHELTGTLVEEQGSPDVVIVDPPRSGLHNNVIQTLLGIKPPKIVYVSCNPATQARDIQLLNDVFKVSASQPVDMFPHTLHVENVVLLERIK